MADTMPATLVPIGHLEAMGRCDYVERRPPEGAPRSVAKVWRSEVRETGLLHVVPDGCVELIRGPDGSVEVWGPSVRPRQVLLERGAAYDGVRIRVGAASSLLGMAVADLADEVVPATGLEPLARLRGRDRQEWLTRILALAEDGAAVWRQDPVACRAPALLARPGCRIPDVAAALGIGERQLRRRFHASVGLSPSAYRRLVRTRSALRDLSSSAAGPTETIAAIAHRRGFTDQSHLTREVVALTGQTPAGLAARG